MTSDIRFGRNTVLLDAARNVLAAQKAVESPAHTGTRAPAGDSEAEAAQARAQLRQSLDVVCMADVKPEQVCWLWPGYIPLGKLTVLEGDPGRGKSTLTLAVAAALSTGAPLPGGTTRAASDVVLVTYEDGLADTLRPRLDAAGADLQRIHAVQGVHQAKGFDRLVQFPTDAPGVFELVREFGATLLVIDPLSAALSGETDSYKDQDIRRVLAPMARFAEETGCAVVVVRHLTKSASGRAITSGGGSIGIGAAARSVLAVHEDPDAPEDVSARVLAVVKNNIAAPSPSLSFRLETAGSESVRVRWAGESKHTADALSAMRLDAGEPIEAEREIDCWLRSMLEDGPVDRKELFERAGKSGFSQRSLDRAAGRNGVHRSQSGFGKDKRSQWSLSSNPAIRANPANGANATEAVGIGGNNAASPRHSGAHGANGGIGAHGMAGNGTSPASNRTVFDQGFTQQTL